jgi:phage tail-like protein
MRSEAIVRLLPAAYQRAARPGSVLSALLSVMDVLHAPSEQRLAAVAELFSPYRTPPEFVPFLAGWVGLDHTIGGPQRSADAPLPLPVGRLRNLVAAAAEIAQWRGTAAGLRTVLETATGVPGFVVEEPADRPFHVVIRVPAAAHPQLTLISRLVEAEKPAAVTCEVVADGEPPESEGVPQ